jgi:hypothetical protein
LSIGLAAAQAMEAAASRVPGSFPGGPLAGRALEALGAYARLRAEIETLWLRPEHRSVETWRDHLDINEVMLATSLAPEGFLVLRPPS